MDEDSSLPFASSANSGSFAEGKVTEDPLKFKGRYTVVNSIQKRVFKHLKKYTCTFYYSNKASCPKLAEKCFFFTSSTQVTQQAFSSLLD